LVDRSKIEQSTPFGNAEALLAENGERLLVERSRFSKTPLILVEDGEIHERVALLPRNAKLPRNRQSLLVERALLFQRAFAVMEATQLVQEKSLGASASGLADELEGLVEKGMALVPLPDLKTEAGEPAQTLSFECRLPQLASLFIRQLLLRDSL